MQLVKRQGNDSSIQIAAEENDKSGSSNLHGSSKGKLSINLLTKHRQQISH